MGPTFVRWLLTAVLFLTGIGNAWAEEVRCESWVAELVSLEGQLSWRDGNQTAWSNVEPGAEPGLRFCLGDELKVVGGRAALRLSNDTLVRLNDQTQLSFHPKQESFWVKIKKGAGYFFSRTPTTFEVKAPYINAAVDGTEFLVAHEFERSRVAVFEGRVLASSQQDHASLTPGMGVDSSSESGALNRLTTKLPDSVAWSLYFPPVVVGKSLSPDVEDLVSEGRMADALAAVKRSYSAQVLSVDELVKAASIGLQQGDVEFAKQVLFTALQRQPENRQARALKALIALVSGNRLQARASLDSINVEQSINQPGSPTVLMVESFILQSEFRLGQALASVESALALAPDDIQVRSRYVELLLLNGHQQQARKSLQRLLAVSSVNAQSYGLAGFVLLSDYAVEEAVEQFNRALQLDTANPQAWLGLGLAEIQSGDLVSGREKIELAVVLDPLNSIYRSYLGKAYYQQRRFGRAQTELQLAKERDPRDPTPWLYSAQLNQARNLHPLAIKQVEQARKLNDHRAVYRSRLMLDSDMAARSANQAQAYKTLGFERLAQVSAADAAINSPSDYAGYRAGVTALAGGVRHETGRASQALLATLMQPIGASSLPPGMLYDRLNSHSTIGPVRLALNEYDALFSRRGLRGYLSGFAGQEELNSLEWQGQWVAEGFGMSAGQYYYNDDSFADSRETDYQVSEMLAQYEPISSLQLQLYLSRVNDQSQELTTETGSLKAFKDKTDDQGVRALFRISEQHQLLADFLQREKQITQIIPPPLGVPRPLTLNSVVEFEKQDLAYQFQYEQFWSKLGALKLDYEFAATPIVESNQLTQFYWEQGIRLLGNHLRLQWGYTHAEDDEGEIEDKYLPSFAWDWQFDSGFAAHVAYWQAVSLPSLPYLQSPNVSVFLRSEDNAVWANTENSAARVSYNWGTLTLAVEALERNINSHLVLQNIGSLKKHTDEQRLGFEVYWIPLDVLSISSGYHFEDGDTDRLPFNLPSVSIETKKLPLNLSYSPLPGWRLTMAAERVWQTVDTEEENRFVNLDFGVSWKSARHPLNLSLELRNILDEQTGYLSGGAATAGAVLTPSFSEFALERSVLATFFYSFD